MTLLKQQNSEHVRTLFSLKSNFRVVRLGEADARTQSDNLKTLTTLVESSEDMYPNIRRWITDKVIPGLRSTERLAWLAYENEIPIATAVLKRGAKAKFCHVRVRADFQDLDLGQLFFTQMTLETRQFAKEIHFSLPESLWESKTKFFESFGFAQAAKAERQYRNGEAELICSAPHEVVWLAALERLPSLARKFTVSGYRLGADLLVSMKPKYADRILSGSKLIEIRKRFSGKWAGCKAVLYSSSPQKALIGEATVRSVTSGNPKDIWSRFHDNLGCTFDEFTAYVGSADQISAIELDEVFPYKEPITLAQISQLLGEDLHPPQSYCGLKPGEKQSGWAKAVTATSVLHGCLSSTKRRIEDCL